MMLNAALILMLTGFAVTQVASTDVVPFGILDDAKEELEILRQTVIGAVFAGKNNLYDFFTDLGVHATNTANEAVLAIQNEAETINTEVLHLKDLANSANVNIAYCLQGREDYLKNLPLAIIQELTKCIQNEVNEGTEILDQYTYLIDITINKVDALDFQLTLCEPDSEPCISAIVEQIDRDIEKLPVDIQLDVQQAQEFFDNLKLFVQDCADLKTSQYVSSANKILTDLVNCVNSVIG